MRLILEISQITKDNWPEDKPVFCRLSATDWYKGGERDSNGEYVSWGMAQSEILMGKLLAMGIDLFDITSGGLEYDQAVWPSPGYNAPLAAQLRKAYPKALMGTVGLIKTPERG
jgi:2,4-dienoyl-CoA reductase-like NADH-dependent reductase (Old Yellow Enzyme family)